MTKRLDFQTLIERKHENRMRREDKAIERQERKEASLRDERVGQLQREREIIYYVFPVGGKYREASDPVALARYL